MAPCSNAQHVINLLMQCHSRVWKYAGRFEKDSMGVLRESQRTTVFGSATGSRSHSFGNNAKGFNNDTFISFVRCFLRRVAQW